MLIDTNKTVSATELNQQLSKVLKELKTKKDIIVMKHNKPAYVILEYTEYEKLMRISHFFMAEGIMDEYHDALADLEK